MKKSLLIIIQILFISNLIAQVNPVDFEPNGNGANWTWAVFENVDNPALEFVANPDPSGINTSATVAKFTARLAGNPWAGCETMHGADIGSFTIDANNQIIRIMVWKDVISDVGIKLVRNDAWSLGEIKVPNTKTNEWEQITFDFSSHMGNNYDQIVIFPDFQTRSTENVIYFDNVYGGLANPTSLNEKAVNNFQLYPNPAEDILNINSTSSIKRLIVYNSTGAEIKSVSPNELEYALNVKDFESGLYMIQMINSDGITSEKFIKK